MTQREAMLIVGAAALWLAALAAWRFAPGLDVLLLGTMEAARGSVVAGIAIGLTSLGEYQAMVAATAIVAAWLLVRGHGKAAVWLLAATLSGRVATAIEKQVFARPRPPLANRLVEATSPSFPSAHAFNTMLVALAVVLALHGGRSALGLAVAFSLAVGTSRIVLGVHYPSDVVAGWASALAWAVLWRPLLPDRRPKRILTHRNIS